MSIYDSKLWILDVGEIVASLPELQELAGKSVLITGGTGLICSAVIDTLIYWNETHLDKIGIVIAGRSTANVKSRFTPYYQKNWLKFLPYDASLLENKFECSCDYIIHGASNASPNKIAQKPVETMICNFMGLKNLLDFAKDTCIKRVLYISSSEVYGEKGCNRPYRVNDYGGIDLLRSRNSYSVSKCAAETLCASYYEEYEVESVIVRPGHIYGPTAMTSDNRVSSAWAFAAARGEDIVMKSEGMQVRSYCYCLDCASAILKVLLYGENMHAYNISNPNSIINIKCLAEIISKYAGVNVIKECPTEDEQKSFNPMNNSSLDAGELLNLGWSGQFDIARGISHTIKILRDCIYGRCTNA